MRKCKGSVVNLIYTNAIMQIGKRGENATEHQASLFHVFFSGHAFSWKWIHSLAGHTWHDNQLNKVGVVVVSLVQ
jgi:hypothetical protein